MNAQDQGAGAVMHPPRASGRMAVFIPLISGFSMIYNQLLSAAFGVFLAAFLGPEAYGTVNLARNIFVNAAFLSPLGLDLALQRHMGQSADHEVADREVGWLRLVSSGLSLFVVAILVFGGASVLEANVFEHSGFGNVLIITILALPFATDLAVLGGAFRGIYKPVGSVVATYIVQPTTRVLFILALLPLVSGLWATLYGTLASWVVAWLVMAFVKKTAFRIHLGRLGRSTAGALRVLRYAPFMGMSTLIYSLARTLDSTSLGAFAALSDVGRYAVVLMMCQLVGTIGNALGQTLGTSIASAAKHGNTEAIRAALGQNMYVSALLSAPLCVTIALWGSDVDLLLGKSYTIDANVFVIAAVTQWIFTVTHNCSSALTMAGRHKTEFYNNIAALVIEAIGCFLLVPKFGLIGAASATLIMVFLLNLIRQIQIGRMLGDMLIRFNLFTPLLVAAVVAVPLVALQHTLAMRAWWLTGLIVTVHIVASLALTLSLFAPRDLRQRLFGLLNRRRR